MVLEDHVLIAAMSIFLSDGESRGPMPPSGEIWAVSISHISSGSHSLPHTHNTHRHCIIPDARARFTYFIKGGF